MPYIARESIEQVKQRADIVDVVGSFVPLKKRGANDYWGCCPFHHEKTPSFKVNQERQLYYCFGCKEHGTLFDFVKAIVNTDFPGAVHWLADRYGIQVEEESGHGRSAEEAERVHKLHEKRQKLLTDAAALYHGCLQHPDAAPARAYLDGRGLTQDAIEQFQLGYSLDSREGLIHWAHDNGYDDSDLEATGLVSIRENGLGIYDRFRGRLMFPIWNELGKVVGFSARVLEKDVKAAKYVNSPETDFFQKGQLLYGLNFARPKLKEFGHVLVCEGQLDVIACHRAGLCNAVAAQGTAFTEMHARLLKKSVSNIVLSFDADTAGWKAAERTIGIVLAAGFQVSIVTLPDGEDPDSIYRKGGAEALRQIMGVTEPAIPYLYRIACMEKDVRNPEGMSEIVTRVMRAVKMIPDALARTGHCQWLAKQVNVPEHTMLDVLERPEGKGAVLLPGVIPGLRPQNPPQFTQPQANEKAWTLLLDLVLHLENLAKELAMDGTFLAGVPATPLGQAITQIVVLTGQDEWASAADAIQDSPLFADALVAKVLASPEVTLPAKDDTHAMERYHKAYADCVCKIKCSSLEERIQEKTDALRQETDTQKMRDLQVELASMVTEKNRLKAQMKALM